MPRVDREVEDARQRFRREVSDAFASNMKRIRKAEGLTQEDLSLRAGLNRIHVGLIERGARVPSLDTVYKLAGGLGVRPGELVDGFRWLPEGNAGAGGKPEEKDKS